MTMEGINICEQENVIFWLTPRGPADQRRNVDYAQRRLENESKTIKTEG